MTWAGFRRSVPWYVNVADETKLRNFYHQVMAHPGCLKAKVHPAHKNCRANFNFKPLTELIVTTCRTSGRLLGLVSQAQLHKVFGVPFPKVKGSFAYRVEDPWSRSEVQLAAELSTYELDCLKKAALVESMYIA